MKTKPVLALWLLSSLALSCLPCARGASAQTLFFGQTAPFHGVAASLGEGAKAGINAAFAEANRTRALKDVTLALISYDDGYEPEQAIVNTRRLVDHDKVFALVGSVGTPISSAIMPILGEEGIPYIGAYTGAEFLRAPFKDYVINLRASYVEETEKLVDYLTDKRGFDRIAVLFQDDSYGRSGLEGVRNALARRKLGLTGMGSYTRNTTSVKTAVLSIRKSRPQAVVLVGTYKACAQFIKVSRGIGFTPVFTDLSFAGTEELGSELGDGAEGVVVSQVIPYPYDSPGNGTLVRRYHAALKAYDRKLAYGYLTLEGYMVGRMTIAVLERMRAPYTREAFIKTVYGMGSIELDDVTLYFGPNDNQGMDRVYLTMLRKNGKPIEIKEVSK